MMKRFAMRVLALVGMSLGGWGMCAVAQAPGQANPMLEPLPLDTAVRAGVLPNGLTYFIRHNETPKGQADFYIAQKVGSILENEQQRGLAHFLEHMCFNGTENFKGNEVVNWLETKGVEFGGDLNAYTGVDETVYHIANVPSGNVAVQDSCLLILHDWADGLLLLPEEIDKERGVIHQEWRRSMAGQMRALEKVLPELYPGTKYGHRLPIGLMSVVDSFPPQVLRDYYETWYRPDQQGIVVVGDIDVDRVEGKIKELFGPIAMPENAPERVYEPVPDTEGTLVAVGTDPEIQMDLAMLFLKSEPMPRQQRNTLMYIMTKYVEDMVSAMLNQRLSDIAAKPDAPFAQADADFGNYFLANTKDALQMQILAKSGELEPGVAAAYRELLRAQRGGFTASEYERARSEYMSRLEKQYNNRKDMKNGELVQPLVRHFIDNTPATDIATRYQLMQMLAPNIPVEVINQAMAQMVTPDNRALLLLAPEKEGHKVPTREEMLAALAAVDAEEIAPHVDEMKAEPLIPQLPQPGSVVATRELPQWGATEWTLSNGAKVVVKKTDFKADEILFGAEALGGTSVIGDEQAATLGFLPYAISQAGLGTYTYSDMQKYLQGKQAELENDFGDYQRVIGGSTTPKDLPTLMELIYMNFTAFAQTPEEFKSIQNMVGAQLHNQETSPQYIFIRNLRSAMYANPRKAQLNSQIVEEAQGEATLSIMRRMLANAADYTFYFVGNVEPSTLKPLVEQYIATLPGDATKPSTIERREGLGINMAPMSHATAKMETPQTWVAIIEAAQMPFTAKNEALIDIAGQILSQRLITKVREDMGAVYSISAYGSMSRVSDPNTMLQSIFPMKPEMKQQVLDLIAAEFKALESNITPEEVAKCVDLSVKRAIADREQNGPWLRGMRETQVNGVDSFNGAEEMLRGITAQEVMNFVKEFNAKGRYAVVVLDPEE